MLQLGDLGLRTKRHSVLTPSYCVGLLTTVDGTRALVFRGNQLVLITDPFILPRSALIDVRARLKALRLCGAFRSAAHQMRAESLQ